MVPKIARKGQSFKGAGLYYLHDKNASTRERVVFTLTENLPTNDPDIALRMMAYTAMHQAELKRASGAAATGRKLAKSVYTYSLSWAPDEQPSQAEMIEAARETMKLLGLDDHEALLVAHNDTDHPHVHIIANRVHPETGLAAKLSNDRLKLSNWAEAYEKKQGKIRCEQRPINNEKRRNGQWVKDTKSLSQAEYHRRRKASLRAAFLRRQAEEKNLSAYHAGQQQALFDEKEARITYRLDQIRDQNRPVWADLYKRQRAETQAMQQNQAAALSRFKYWLKNRDRSERGFMAGAIRALLGRNDPAAELSLKHEAERATLSRDIRQQQRDAIAQENKFYRAERDKMARIQAGESATLKATHAKESQDLARKIKAESGQRHPAADSEKEPVEGAQTTLSEEFRKRVEAARKKRQKRGSRGKGHGRERE